MDISKPSYQNGNITKANSAEKKTIPKKYFVYSDFNNMLVRLYKTLKSKSKERVYF